MHASTILVRLIFISHFANLFEFELTSLEYELTILKLIWTTLEFGLSILEFDSCISDVSMT